MITAPDVLCALRGLGPGAHGTRDVWWALVGAGWADATDTPTVRLGDVERALDEAWEAEAVERSGGRWRLPVGRDVQMRLGER